MSGDSEKRDEVLRRLLKTPPTPHKPPAKTGSEADPMPDDPDALMEWAKRNISKE